MTIAVPLVRAVVECAERAGVEPAALYARARLRARLVDDRDARVPTPAYLRLFAAAVESTDDAALGPRVATFIDGAAFGLLGFLVASCATLGDALARFSRNSRLLCDELRVEVVPRDDEVALCYGLDAEPQVPAFFEMALAHMVSTARRGTRGVFRPRRIVFRHRARPTSLRKLGGAPIEYGAVEDAVYLDRAALALPLRGANATLMRILDDHAATVLQALPPDDDLLGRVRSAIRVVLPRGEPALALIAARLGVGGRTLQRRLRERGLTLRAVVDDVRRECALLQLADPQVSVAEVAFALGFSGPSAFHHAFRRWTGRTPGRRR